MSRGGVEIAFEPLTALAGGILGGVLVAVIAWRQLTRADATTHQGFGARRTTGANA